MGANGTNPYANAVDEAEGLDKIEDLQNHEQEEIYDKAANILEAFFDIEDGEVENLAPQVRTSQSRSCQGPYPAICQCILCKPQRGPAAGERVLQSVRAHAADTMSRPSAQ